MTPLWIVTAVCASLFLVECLLRFFTKKTGTDPTPWFCPLNQPKARNTIQPLTQCLTLSHIEPGLTVLALGLETGDQVHTILKHLGRDGVFVGIEGNHQTIRSLESALTERVDPSSCASWEIYHVQDTGDLPFPPESFDVVFILKSLSSIRRSEHFLIDSYRVLKKGGILSVNDYLPNRFFNLPQIPRRKLAQTGFSSFFFSGSILAYTLIARKEGAGSSFLRTEKPPL